MLISKLFKGGSALVLLEPQVSFMQKPLQPRVGPSVTSTEGDVAPPETTRAGSSWLMESRPHLTWQFFFPYSLLKGYSYYLSQKQFFFLFTLICKAIFCLICFNFFTLKERIVRKCDPQIIHYN